MTKIFLSCLAVPEYILFSRTIFPNKTAAAFSNLFFGNTDIWYCFILAAIGKLVGDLSSLGYEWFVRCLLWCPKRYNNLLDRSSFEKNLC